MLMRNSNIILMIIDNCDDNSNRYSIGPILYLLLLRLLLSLVSLVSLLLTSPEQHLPSSWAQTLSVNCLDACRFYDGMFGI